MKPTKTIPVRDIEECDLLFYRPSSLFGLLIKFFDSLRYGRMDIAFSHVAIAIRDSDHTLRRYDAMEGFKTGFRPSFENCYVFKLNLTIKERHAIVRHCLSRGGSKYDKRGILSHFTRVQEDEFCDYCSELIKNALLNTVYWNRLQLQDKNLSPLRLYLLLRDYTIFKWLCLW